MQDQKPSISLIIAVYKKPEFLELVLLSCMNQHFRDFEIIIADDGSGADICDVIKKYCSKFKYPILHCWHEDSGFRKTIIANKAAQASNAGYLVFIDGDCVLHHHFLDIHAKYRAKNVVLSGRRVRLDSEKTASITRDDIISHRIENPIFWMRHCPLKDIKQGLYIPNSSIFEKLLSKRPRRILGCNFSLHTSDFFAINGYDERIIGRGMEDSNLYERALLHSFRFRSIVREAIQYHLFHSFDPIPHSEETKKEFCMPTQSWTPYGIKK